MLIFSTTKHRQQPHDDDGKEQPDHRGGDAGLAGWRFAGSALMAWSRFVDGL
jgi:hypothetical protein